MPSLDVLVHFDPADFRNSDCPRLYGVRDRHGRPLLSPDRLVHEIVLNVATATARVRFYRQPRGPGRPRSESWVAEFPHGRDEAVRWLTILLPPCWHGTAEFDALVVLWPPLTGPPDAVPPRPGSA